MANFTGTGGNDIWTGGVADDFATGEGGNDTLSGGGGNDLIAGNAGADTLNGGDGDDTLYSYNIDPAFPHPGYLSPGISSDVFAEVDTLIGGNGDDYIFAGYGDNVDGGAQGSYGNRLYISFMGATSGVTADFRILQSTGSITIGGGTITNIENIGYIEGSNYDDFLVPIDTGYPSGHSVYGRGGNDHIIADYYSGWGGGALYGDEGNDILDARTAQYGPSLYGGTGDDTLYTNSNGFSIAYGGDGNDLIYSHAETWGGAGNDTIVLSFTYYGGLVRGEEGDDTITGAIQGNYIAGGAGADVINGDDGNDFLGSGDFLVGTSSLDLDTGADHDEVNGAGGDDQISVGYGDDADGGSGSDTLRLSLAGATVGVVVDLSDLESGSTAVIGGGTLTGFETIEYVGGSSYADRIIIGTHAQAVTVDGGAGNDTITTGGSSAIVNGGAGNDRIFSGAAADTIDGGEGRDIIDYRLYASGVTVDLAGGTGAGGDTITNVESALGSEFADTLSGDSLANTLTGNGGDDIIYGRGGNDALTGGAGNDLLYGGLGNDLYYVSDAGDAVIEAAGEGFDTVKSTISYTLGDNVERLALGGAAAINGTGNGIDNNLTGNSAANTLLGLGGADFIIGGGGLDQLNGGEDSDTYYVASFAEYADAHFTDSGSTGWDIVRFAGTMAGTLVMQAGDTGIEEIDVATSSGPAPNFSGTTAINVDASALTNGVIIRGNSGINMLTGTAFNDNLYGNNGNDTLNGGDGHDVLDGGRGNDVMTGGNGVDVYYVDSVGDTVVETASIDGDAVFSTISYTLGTYVENLVLQGTNNLNGTGNDSNNSLTGNIAANILTGLGGMDNLDGGAGNDSLYGGDSFDWLTGGAGRDQLSGGSGGDIFNFDEGHFAGMTTNTSDRILDFSQAEGDKVRLEDIDANSVLGGEQSFSFIGTDAFHGTAGELRYYQSSGNTYVQGDINGDGAADFMIRIDGLHTLQLGDFMI